MLFKKHTLEHGKTYALSTAVLAGILFIALFFFGYINRGHLRAGEQTMLFVFVMSAAGSIFGSMIFADLGDKSKAIPALMLPASHFEKYLVGLIYSYFIFLAVFVATFYLADVIVVDIMKHELEEDKVINVFDPNGKPAQAYVIFTLFHAFAFFGAIFFKKLHFIKTAILFFICFGLLFLINAYVLNMLFAAHTQFEVTVPFGGISIVENDNFSRLVVTDDMFNYGKVIFVIVILLFWTVTYFRLKEKEV